MANVNRAHAEAAASATEAVDALVKILQEQLEQQANLKEGEINFAHVGSLVHIANRVAEITEAFDK